MFVVHYEDHSGTHYAVVPDESAAATRAAALVAAGTPRVTYYEIDQEEA